MNELDVLQEASRHLGLVADALPHGDLRDDTIRLIERVQLQAAIIAGADAFAIPAGEVRYTEEQVKAAIKAEVVSMYGDRSMVAVMLPVGVMGRLAAPTATVTTPIHDKVGGDGDGG